MEERNLLIQKYIFPVLVILMGLMLLNTAIFSGTGSTSQSGTFLLGALVVVAMGVVTILYIKEIITKKTHLSILSLMLISCLLLGYSTYSSISTTIAQIDLKKKIDSNIKQGLRDIEIIQLEYKKKYGWYSDNFEELKRFLLNDSVYSISTKGIVPDYKITPEHCEILGYDPILDYIQIESYDEQEALKCGLLNKDTSWENVLVKLFDTSQDSSNNRLYNFDINNFDLVPMSQNKYFKIDAKILESNDDITFEVLLHRKDDKYNFVSSYLIDYNGNDKAYYGKDIKGLIVKDSIPQMPQLLIGDNIVLVDSISFNKSEDFLNALKNKKKDTIRFQILRSGEKIELKLTQKDIISRPSRAFWTDFQDVLSYNLQPPLYNPELFEPFHVGKNIIVKEDEFSSPHLEIGNFKKLAINHSIDTNSITFEFFKGQKTNYSDFNLETEDYFYLLSKVGTPVFIAYDPSPYDPLNERDTLITGSLNEVKTSGNWK
ncbi:MAG: hypothetical protein CL821_08515 [Crocinitomicaceae bacterium]|nr:hypothetical protein [Crocinitomicaceae bacterium]